MKLKKFRGQHLLTDANMIGKIVQSANLGRDDLVIEIGAGTGILTRQLAASAGRVLAFEIDNGFREGLKELERETTGLEVRMEDFLGFPLARHLEEHPGRWRIVANIPYNITSPILEKVINERRPNLLDTHLLMQREVARRMTAPPGSKDYGRLSVLAQFFSRPEILFTVPPDVFTPPPQVESALLRMTFRDELLKVNSRLYFAVVKAAFEQRRKQLGNTLKNIVPGFSGPVQEEVMERAGIDRQRRGETLGLKDFETLSNCIEDYLRQKNIKAF
jgi:16S rRNA (adenine1518-N6/adenine1519-N6)-dimethyltransferase